MHWAILRSPSFYPIKTQFRIITACYLIHNLIRREMSIDLIEVEFNMNQSTEDLANEKVVGSVASSDELTAYWD